MHFYYTISKPAAVIHESTSIAQTLKLMTDRNISSILLHNNEEFITGIFTERDVIRRICLLDLNEKLERPILTVSTREVFFADHKQLHESLVRLHFEKKIRHFPVLEGGKPHLSHLIGMVTVTDVIRYFLALDVRTELAQRPLSKHTPSPARPLPIICHTAEMLQFYKDAFSPINLAPYRIEDLPQFFDDYRQRTEPLVFDFDGFPQKTLSHLVVKVTSYAGHLIMTTTNPAIVSSFRPYLEKNRQTIAAKPLDLEYLSWLLFTKWRSIDRQASPKIPTSA